MRASRFEAALDEVHVAEPLEHAIVGDGMLARLAVGEYGHLHPVAQTAADISGHGALVGIHVAPYQRVVDPVDRMVEKLLGQPGVRPLVLRDDQNARRVLVDAVDEPGSHVPALKQRQILEVVRERVD